LRCKFTFFIWLLCKFFGKITPALRNLFAQRQKKCPIALIFCKNVGDGTEMVAEGMVAA